MPVACMMVIFSSTAKIIKEKRTMDITIKGYDGVTISSFLYCYKGTVLSEFFLKDDLIEPISGTVIIGLGRRDQECVAVLFEFNEKNYSLVAKEEFREVSGDIVIKWNPIGRAKSRVICHLCPARERK